MMWLSRRPWLRALAWLGFLAPFFYLSYGLANHWAAGRAAVPSIVFEWEHQIPFWAWTIFPYWSINAFYGLSLFLCRTRHELDRHALRLLTAQVVAVSCFLALPMAFSFGQPAATGAAGFMFDALRGFDKPFNQAPSLHIALAVILWDFYRRLITPAWARAVLHVWTLAICFSVLTTYQHHFIDIPTGALLGLLCVALWPLERRLAMPQLWRWHGDAARGRLAMRYALGALAVFALALWTGGVALWLMWIAVALALVALNYAGLGARGFAKQRAGNTDWAVQWLLAPYKIGAWINSRWWTRHAPLPREIVHGVWLGRLPGGIDHRHALWTSVVDLTAEFSAPRRVPTRAVPMLDLAVPPPAQLRRAARAIAAQHRQHGAVLVHCALGYSRSAAATATWLALAGHAASIPEAIALIRRVRPEIVLDAAWLAAIAAAVQPNHTHAETALLRLAQVARA
jgi:protein-tyrosine phosphatase/membrane-associated phospholipid phosphatase